MERHGIDPIDGAPVWFFAPGQVLTHDLLAVEQLGVGLRCQTWLAWSTALWHLVVVRMARPHQLEHPHAARSLRRQVEALDGNPHPLLPRLFADRTAERLPHLVVEYVDGRTLDDCLAADGPLEVEETAVLGAQLLPALCALHARGLAHLAVRSENIVLRNSSPVLVDCARARHVGTPQPAGTPPGTEGCVAPEQEAGEPVSAEMDYYGFGTVLAETVTGKPFEPDAPLPDTPLTGLVQRLLSPDPADRGTPAEILLALAAAASGRRPWPEWGDRWLHGADRLTSACGQ